MAADEAIQLIDQHLTGFFRGRQKLRSRYRNGGGTQVEAPRSNAVERGFERYGPYPAERIEQTISGPGERSYQMMSE